MSLGSVLLTIALALAALLLLARLWGRRNAQAAEAAAPRLGTVTPVRGGAIHWTDEGPRDGAAVVCIHGLSGNLRNFTYAMTPLLTDRYRVIALDRPGCGYSKRRGFADAGLAAQARMIAELLEREGIERPILAGHSLGGALSLQLALDYPDRVGALALLAPLTRPATPPMFTMIDIPYGWARAALGGTVAGALGPMQADKILAEAFAPDPAPADFRAKGGGDLALRAGNFVTSAEDLTASRPSLEAMAPRITTLRRPGAILFGDQDAVLEEPVHGAAFAERAPSLTYQRIAGAGHMLPVTHPEACAAFIDGVAARLAEPA